MTYAHLTAQQRNLCIIEDLGDKAHATMSAYGLAVMYRYACCLLSPVLQGIEGIVNGLSYIIARLIEGNPNNAAGIVQLKASSNPLFSSTWHFAALPNDQTHIERTLFS
jgi:hypothetical protein